MVKVANWRGAVIYGAACAAAFGVYLVVHLAPDFPNSLTHYAGYVNTYVVAGNVGVNFFDLLPNYILPFMIFLAPVEILVYIIPGVILLRWGTALDRIITVTLWASVVVVVGAGSTTYGYMALFAPFVAYVAARAMRHQITVLVGVFVLIPALLSAPVYDLMTEIDANTNARQFAELDQLTWRIPEGVTVLGEDEFWYTLHPRRKFIGLLGLSYFAGRSELSRTEAMDALDMAFVICRNESILCSAADESGAFALETPFDVAMGNYLLYKRVDDGP